jgi:hypothetical protein
MLAITCGSWIDVAIWWMKKIRTPMSRTTSAIETVMERCGTKAPCAPGEIETSVSTA